MKHRAAPLTSNVDAVEKPNSSPISGKNNGAGLLCAIFVLRLFSG